MDMDLEQKLRAALVPCEPGTAPMEAVMASLSRSRKGRFARRTLLPAALVVAAAAAIFASLQRPPIQVAGPTPVVSDMPAAQEEVEAQKRAGSAAVTANARATEPVESVVATPASVQPFSVRVELRNRATGAAAQKVDAVHAALLAQLGAMPGLTLVEGVAEPAAAAGSQVYRFMMIGSEGKQQGDVVVVVAQNAVESPDGGVSGSLMISNQARVATQCPGGMAAVTEGMPCTDADSVASSLLDFLRARALPPDPSHGSRLQARLVNPAADPFDRLKALSDLLGQGTDRANSRKVSVDATTIRGAIDLAATAASPEVRAQVWHNLRNARRPELIDPMVASMRNDPDGQVRLEAVATLSADFAADAGVRSALASTARDDARPLVRALAQRTLSGEATWKQYVMDSLQDTSRTTEGRIEALLYQLYEPSPAGISVGKGRTFLDADVIHAASDVLPLAANLPAMNKGVLRHLLLDLAQVRDPSVPELVLALLKASSDETLGAGVVATLAGMSDAPGVRAVLEKLRSADD
jgi:hypothetical protein